MTQLARIEQKLDYILEYHGIRKNVVEHLSDSELQDYINSRISYDPDTGALTWIKGHQRGNPVGRSELSTDGFRLASIRQQDYSLAQIAWLIHNGELVDTGFKTSNDNPEDLRINNLNPMGV